MAQKILTRKAMDKPKKNFGQRFFYLLLYVFAAIAASYFFLQPLEPTLLPKSHAPIDEKFYPLGEEAISFKEALKKPMLINFWSSSCPSCLEELPVINDLQDKYREEILFLALATSTSMAEAIWLKNHLGLSLPLALVDDEVVKKWGAFALPTTYIVSKNGLILFSHIGIMSKMEFEIAIDGVLR